MIDVYLDLETIPSQDPAFRAEALKAVKAPGQFKKPESIVQWLSENAVAAADEAVAKTSFDPAHGHICCIGFAFEDKKAASYSATSVQVERSMLENFFNDINGLPTLGMVRIIGHNVSAFDLRFLLCRAIVLGVTIPRSIPRDIKPWGEFVFDTMTAWAGPRGTIGQDRLAKALGMKGKGDFDGSMVAEAWVNGEHEKIAAYCRNDIDVVREIHRRFKAVGF